MTPVENYHDWLRDAHAMEKQAESMLEAMESRIENYPELRDRISQHLVETRAQIVVLEDVFVEQDVSRSLMKDAIGKMAAMGQAVGGIFNSDEIVKGAIGGYVFEQFEIACYTSLIAAAEEAGDNNGALAFRKILAEEVEMAEWLLEHIPDVTRQFIMRSNAPGAEAKK